MENKIEIEILYESKDFWRSYISTYFSLSSIFYQFLALAVFGFFLAFLFLRKELEMYHLADVLLFAFGFTIFFGIVFSSISVRSALRLTDGKCKYIISREKVEVIAREFRTETDWSWFHRAKETGNYFFLYSKGDQAHLLPKRFFDSEEINDFKNLLRSKFGGEAYLRKSRKNLGLK